MLAALLCSTGFTPRFTLGRSLETISTGAEAATLPPYSSVVRRAKIGCRAPRPVLSFDESAYEEDRLARDAEAMAAMAAEEAKAAEDAKFAALRTPWKWVIRRHASRSLGTTVKPALHSAYGTARAPGASGIKWRPRTTHASHGPSTTASRTLLTRIGRRRGWGGCRSSRPRRWSRSALTLTLTLTLTLILTFTRTVNLNLTLTRTLTRTLTQP